MDVATMLRRSCWMYRDGIAVTSEGRTQTYAQLWERACRLANGLHDMGLAAGDRVAVLAEPQFETVEVIAGLALAGLVRVPLAPSDAVSRQVQVLADVEASACIVHERLQSDLAVIRVGVPSLRHVVVVGRDASSSYDELLGSASAVPPPVFVPADADHVIVHTSGSSGQAKGVVHSGASWLAGGNELLAHLPTVDEDDALLVLPGVSHTSGLFVLPFLARGARCVLTPVLDPAAYLRLVELERCTVMPVWPELVELLSAVPEATTRDLSHVRAVIYGYRPLSARTVAMGTRLFGDVLFQFYGQAEAIPATVLTPRHHATRPSERERRILASAGRPTVNTDLTVREGDRVLPPGETGELCVQTPGTMRRIWGDPVGTAARFTPDGAVRTQDVGYLDEDGFLHVVDRREDLIVSSGQEVWPVEVERTLATHPDVREAAVVGVPDEELGEAVLAVVVLREGAVVSAEDLVAWAGERLDPVRAPGQVVVSQTPLPRHRTGKLLRGQIRARHDPGWSPAGR